MCRGRWIITQIPPGPHSSVPVLTLVLPYVGQSLRQVATRTVRICVGATRNDLFVFFVLSTSAWKDENHHKCSHNATKLLANAADTEKMDPRDGGELGVQDIWAWIKLFLKLVYPWTFQSTCARVGVGDTLFFFKDILGWVFLSFINQSTLSGIENTCLLEVWGRTEMVLTRYTVGNK